nr:maestro heat-like repeat-containing protein family member 1 [Lepeophtheirus salmonis]
MDEKTITINNNGDKDALSMVFYSLITNVSSNSVLETVKKASITSLSTMGHIYPVRVISALLDAFERCGSGQNFSIKEYIYPNRVNILKAIDSLMKDGHVSLMSDEISHRPLIGRLISLMILEITRCSDIVHEVQGPCSSILTALSKSEKNVDRVIDNLTTKLEQSPHYYIIYTVGSVASTNPNGIVPYLTNILPIFVSNLKNKLKDHYKYSYSVALLKCCEAIQDVMANSTIDIGNKRIDKKDYVKDMDAAHDVLFFNWLTAGSLSRDLKMRYSILEAISSMYPLLSDDRVEKGSISILTVLLTLYKKLPEPYYVSLCISQLLIVIEGKETDLLENTIDTLLSSLFQQVIQNIDHSKPTSTKNQNEVFRCYDVLATSPNYNGKLIDMLLIRLNAKEESSCIKAMLILKHLLNSNINKLLDRLDDIISALYLKLHDPSIQIRKVLAQLTVLLGNSGYLRNEIGKEFIQFIVHQTAINGEETELVDMCDSILKLLVNGQSNSLLWPYLLDYLFIPEYLNSVPSLIRALSLVVELKLKNEASNLKIEYDKLAHIDGSYTLFSRLIVLSAFPFDKSGGICIIRTYQKLGSFDSYIMLKLLTLKKTVLSGIKHNGKIGSWVYLKTAFFYNQSEVQRSFIIKCLGISIKMSKVRLIILENLSEIFMLTNHLNLDESCSCAQAFGQVSMSHPDLALNKLENLVKNILPKSRSGGILNYFLRGESRVVDENRFTKCTIYSCLTEIASVGGIQTDKSNFVVDKFIVPAIKSNDYSIKLEGIRALSSLASSPDIVELQQSTVLLNASICCIKDKDFPDRRVALKCAFCMLQISKELPDNYKKELLDACFKYAMPMLFKYLSEKKDEFEEYTNLFKDIIIITMKFDMEQSTLDELFTRLEDYLKRENDLARDLGSSLLYSAVNTYLDNVTFRIGAPSTFAPGPYMIGSLVPRCFDLSSFTRKNSISSLDVVLKILCLYEGRKLPNKEECFLKTSLVHDAKQCGSDIISVLSSKISYDHMFPFCHSIIEGVLDKIEPSAQGTSCVLLGLMEERGREMFNHAPSLALKILEKLVDVHSHEVRNRLITSILVLMKYNTRGVIEALLTVRRQDDEMLSMIWKQLPIFDSVLTTTVIDYLIDAINVDEMVKENINPLTEVKVKNVDILALAAINSLAQMFKVSATENSLGNYFAEILVPLTLALGSTVGSIIPKNAITFSDLPYNITQSAITLFLSCKNHNVIDSIISTCQNMTDIDPDLSFNDMSFITFLSQFTSVLVEDFAHQISKLITMFEPFLNHKDLGKSLTAVIFYSTLLSENGIETVPLAEKLMLRLTSNKEDKNDNPIKIVIMKGFSNYKCPDSLVLKLIGILLDLIDHDESPVVFYALNTVRDVINNCKILVPLHVLSTLGLKVRPFFDSGGIRLGEAAIRLFGSIVDFYHKEGNEDYKSEVIDQIRGVLISVLLHTNDTAEGVKSASTDVASRIERIINPKVSFDQSEYANYLNSFIKVLSTHEDFKDILPIFASNCLSYFSSPHPQLRQNAVLLLLPLAEHSARLAELADPICKSLDKLLNDKDDDVRITASHHLGSICLNIFKNQEL